MNRGTCTNATLAYAVDLTLARGWNRVGIAVSNVLTSDPIDVAIAIEPGTALFAHPVYSTP